MIILFAILSAQHRLLQVSHELVATCPYNCFVVLFLPFNNGVQTKSRALDMPDHFTRLSEMNGEKSPADVTRLELSIALMQRLRHHVLNRDKTVTNSSI